MKIVSRSRTVTLSPDAVQALFNAVSDRLNGLDELIDCCGGLFSSDQLAWYCRQRQALLDLVPILFDV